MFDPSFDLLIYLVTGGILVLVVIGFWRDWHRSRRRTDRRQTEPALGDAESSPEHRQGDRRRNEDL